MRPCVRVCVCACVYTIIAVFCLFIGVFCMFIGVFCILIGVHCICLGVFCMFKVSFACLRSILHVYASLLTSFFLLKYVRVRVVSPTALLVSAADWCAARTRYRGAARRSLPLLALRSRVSLVAVCCSVLQCGAVCCSELQCVAVRCVCNVFAVCCANSLPWRSM